VLRSVVTAQRASILINFASDARQLWRPEWGLSTSGSAP
jgi:hypothetical protein